MPQMPPAATSGRITPNTTNGPTLALDGDLDISREAAPGKTTSAVTLTFRRRSRSASFRWKPWIIAD